MIEVLISSLASAFVFNSYTLHNVCAVHQGVFSTPGDVQYTRLISLNTPGGVQYSGGYHKYTGGYRAVHRGMFSTPRFPYKFNSFPNDLLSHLS